MSTRYETHASRLQSEAKREHSIWIARMSPEERAQAKSLGVDSEPDDDSEVGGHSPWSTNDIAESPLASITFDLADLIDTPAEQFAERYGLSVPQAARILRWHASIVQESLSLHLSQMLGIIVGGLLSAKNPKLSSAGLAFAASLDALNGLGCQREYAIANGLSPSALSKVVKAWQRSLGLRPSVHQKSEDACTTYSEIGKSRHWRTQQVTHSSASKLLAKITNTHPSLN